MTVVWSHSAHRGLGAAVAWWLGADAQGLPGFLEELRRAIASIERFPMIGPQLTRDGDERLRTVLVGPYRLVYRVTDSVILLVQLHHVRRHRR